MGGCNRIETNPGVNVTHFELIVRPDGKGYYEDGTEIKFGPEVKPDVYTIIRTEGIVGSRVIYRRDTFYLPSHNPDVASNEDDQSRNISQAQTAIDVRRRKLHQRVKNNYNKGLSGEQGGAIALLNLPHRQRIKRTHRRSHKT